MSVGIGEAGSFYLGITVNGGQNGAPGGHHVAQQRVEDDALALTLVCKEVHLTTPLHVATDGKVEGSHRFLAVEYQLAVFDTDSGRIGAVDLIYPSGSIGAGQDRVDVFVK